MAKFHVDASAKIVEIANKIKLGGYLSVRMAVGLRPIITLGHDECIFKQYQFTNKSWVGNDGGRPIILKDEGAGIMISAFQSREFGFGYPMSSDQLEKVNNRQSC